MKDRTLHIVSPECVKVVFDILKDSLTLRLGIVTELRQSTTAVIALNIGFAF